MLGLSMEDFLVQHLGGQPGLCCLSVSDTWGKHFRGQEAEGAAPLCCCHPNFSGHSGLLL